MQNDQSQNPPAAPPPITNTTSSKVSAEDLIEPGETLVTTVKRHSIGIVFYWLEAIVATAALIVLIIVLTPSVAGSNTRSAYGLMTAIGVLLLAILAGVMLLVTYVYRKSQLLVTDHSLIEVLQRSLFNRKISRLSMSNVEDVNCEQRGVIQMLFNYGTLTVQTAGEQDNFVFPYCPNPNKYADRILEARQAYAHGEAPPRP